MLFRSVHGNFDTAQSPTCYINELNSHSEISDPAEVQYHAPRTNGQKYFGVIIVLLTTTGASKPKFEELSEISHHAWRESCGAVMQDGYIFNDTILCNIAVGEDKIDRARVKDAAQIASIDEFISDLPLAYDTKIGQNGMGLSAGQKQRILIARAVYKNPDILLFDEATSALDARNEKIIIENLDRFFRGKTVIVIAHRLSTVKSADKIVVLEKGEITEEGTHESLLRSRSGYFNLVRNQLELGN